MLLLLLALMALFLGCRPARPANPPFAVSTAKPTTAPTAAATLPPSLTKAAATSTVPAATAVSETTISVGGEPDSSPLPPEARAADRTIFTSGLVTAERDILRELSGAPLYKIDFAIADSMDVITGQQTVIYTNQEDVPLQEVYFHLHPITLDGAMAVDDVTVDGVAVETAVDGPLLRVALPSPLQPGETATLAMRFETNVPREIGRNYGVLAYYQDILALAHFYPMLAVYDGTGWNTSTPDIQGDLTYSDSAFYLVRVTAPGGIILVGSGLTVDRTSDGDQQTVTFALGPARDFFLAAGDFAVVSGSVGETTINSYAPAELIDGAKLALEVAEAALADFGERLGPYPYTELDIVTTSTSALGIEYPGLIAGTINMYDIGRFTRSGRSYADILESTTAHEVAHQWFYNLVGNDQLDEPWLDEALASYSVYRYYLARYGQEAAERYFDMFYDRFAGMTNVKPAGLPVAAYAGDEYSASVYGRGPVFVRTLEEFMGRAAFDAFLLDYNRQFRWKIADQEAFRALAEVHCGCDLEPLFAEWINE